jgi:uncharacterized protein
MSQPVQITRLKKSEFYRTIGELDARKNSQILPSQLPLHELSRKIAESIVTDPSTEVPECLSCGVCCAFALMVTLTPNESGRLNNYWDVTLDGVEKDITINRVLPRSLETGHCTFLNGSLGVKIDCEIYEDRPQPCRDFDAGSDKCHAYRRMYGLEPPLTETEIAAAMAKFEVKPPPQKISFVGIVKDADYSMFDREGELLSTGIKLRIVAFLDEDGETEHDLHIYDPEKETWFENEFLTLSLDEARELIASRAVKDA